MSCLHLQGGKSGKLKRRKQTQKGLKQPLVVRQITLDGADSSADMEAFKVSASKSERVAASLLVHTAGNLVS